jgi:mitochondrial fission process protein 1
MFVAVSMSSPSSTAGCVEEKDINSSYSLFRDSPIRYLGYANEVGESFRFQYPKYVMPSYVLAFGYCAADAITTGYNAYHSQEKIDNDQKLTRTLIGSLDTLLWQSLASVAVPGFCINMIVKATRYTVLHTPKQLRLSSAVVMWLPTCAGLGSIPFIVHPIDESVDCVLDRFARPLYRENLPPL